MVKWKYACTYNATSGYPERKGCNTYNCLGSVIAIVLVSFGAIAFSLRQFMYSNNSNDVNGPGEVSVRSFSYDLNSVLCHAYEVWPFFPADVFRVYGAAKIEHKHRVVRRRTTRQLNPHSIFTQNSFYLLEGSLIFARACKRNDALYADSVVELLLFKGDHSWQAWLGGECYYCPLRRVTVGSSHRCPNDTANLTFTVKERNTYYVALNTMEDQTEDFKAELEVKSTTFDLEHAHRVCPHSTDCKINLRYNEDVDIILRFSDTSAFSSFGSQCITRIWFWVCVFAVVPVVIIGITLTICGWVAYNDRKTLDIEESDFHGDSKTPQALLGNNESPPSYDSTGKI